MMKFMLGVVTVALTVQLCFTTCAVAQPSAFRKSKVRQPPVDATTSKDNLQPIRLEKPPTSDRIELPPAGNRRPPPVCETDPVPTINPADCEGKSIVIVCIAPAQDPETIQLSCDRTTEALKAIGCNNVTRIDLDEPPKPDELKEELKGSDIVILNGHGIDDDGCWKGVGKDGTVYMDEEDVAAAVPKYCSLLVATCNAGALDTPECKNIIAYCLSGWASVPWPKYDSDKCDINSFLPWCLTSEQPTGKDCKTVWGPELETKLQKKQADCELLGGKFTLGEERPELITVYCRIYYESPQKYEGGSLSPWEEDFSYDLETGETEEDGVKECFKKAERGLDPESFTKKVFWIQKRPKGAEICCSNFRGRYFEHPAVGLPKGKDPSSHYIEIPRWNNTPTRGW